MKSPCPELFQGKVPKTIGINRLILLLTDASYSPFLQSVFLKTFRDKVSPNVVLQKLIERYFIRKLKYGNDVILSDYEKSYFTLELYLKIKRNVLLFIEKWLTEYTFDFNNEMREKLLNFLNQIPSNQNYFDTFNLENEKQNLIELKCGLEIKIIERIKNFLQN
jgi:hypothetical protein